ncbi:extracellular solute-binding protein [Paenibacillus sp. R14(2021)]|uniref:extracellular solute-binding protein n=1 Tax=Paenibacillus sp. R14(2021) TaxID=2859228 RepID=UPI001C612C8E|nr:extracellular solute-binding protein [Paenibacillus sp. R14(2021)]
MKRKAFLTMLTIMLLLTIVPAMQASRADAADGAPVDKGSDTDDILDSLFGDPTKTTDGMSTPAQGEEEQSEETDTPIKRVVEDSYSDVLGQWHADGIKDAIGTEIIIHPADFSVPGGKTKLASDSKGYDEPVFSWDDSIPSIDLNVNAPQDGLYTMQVDYYSLSDKIIPIERAIQVNGKYPFFEARRFVLPKLWTDETATFAQDALGNELPSSQKQIKAWQSMPLLDASYFTAEPLRLHLKQGANSIKLIHVRESALIGRIAIRAPEALPSYEQYRRSNDVPQAERALITVEAEHPLAKSEPSIRAIPSGDTTVQPHRLGKITLNTLGGESAANEQAWQLGGQRVTWQVQVEQTGSYQLAYKYLQNKKTNMPVFRTLLIDGKVPFAEVQSYPFTYTSDWRNEVFSSQDGKPFQFALGQGQHTITLAASPAPYGSVVQTIRSIMWDINTLTLEIKMATGNTMDANRDWDVEGQMPNLADQLKGYAAALRKQYDLLKALSGKKPDEAANMVVSAEILERLAASPEKIPYQYNRLSEGSGSVLQMLGVVNAKLPNQPLQIDRFYVYADSKLPGTKTGFFRSLMENVQLFFQSFTKDYSKVAASDDEDTLQIWVNRSRQNVSLMQQLANQEFTKKTGIKVALSLMPDEQKLNLAAAAGRSPDAALGVSNYIPFRLAARGALADMNQFEGYEDVHKQFSPGAFASVMFDNKVYALPETQNFWVLFYRKDILDGLNIPVPDTMEEVKAILPELQRFGMNFYSPLSATGGFKPYTYTIPFINQNGGKLYSDDGLRTELDTDESLAGFKQMTDLFTVYSVPMQVPSFYNQFRDGSLPIGIADFPTYVQLTAAAPELAGWWKIAPYPGVKNKEGEVVRSAPGTGATGIIFKSSKKKEQAWAFLQWWTSMETQVRFGNDMESIYGPTYKWNTANLAAFEQLSWPKEDIEVIKEQWKWLWDVPRYLGDYMVEREISDAWNKIVFDGYNARRALEDAVINSNREIKKQLTDFGYMKDGKAVKILPVPDVQRLVKEGDRQ